MNNRAALAALLAECRRRRAPGLPVAADFGQSMAYNPDLTSVISNPERGWYAFSNLLTWRDFSSITNRGFTLTHSYVRFDNYRTQPLPSSVINDLRDGLFSLRAYGIKTVLRFGYNFGFDPDAPYEWVLHHIGQLSPTLHDFADVISSLQAGFIGAWGEWHSSTNNLITNSTYRNGIFSALLENTPSSMMVEFRMPVWIMHYWGATHPSLDIRFTGTPRARTAHHNDCIGAGETMGGSYAGWDGPWTAQQEREYAFAMGRIASFGGETCDISGLNQWNDGDYIIGQMKQLGLDYLNRDFWTPMLDKWAASGHLIQFERFMGYRLRLSSVFAPLSVRRGEQMPLLLVMLNDGWGKVYNPRAIEVVLVPQGGGSAITLSATEDARRQLPLGVGLNDPVPVDVPLTVTIPSNTAVGNYDLYLRLPDPSSTTVRNDARYCIRLANTGGIYDSSNGRHNLGLTVAITD